MHDDRPMDHSATTDLSPCFCANVDCALHVRRGDPQVDGWGDWAVRPDGVVTGRAVYDGRVLCDLCGRRERRALVDTASAA
jgi:hypothetical protein